MKISVSVNGLDAVQARLRGLADGKIRAAAKAALNVAAFEATKQAKAEMSAVFDRPTNWVLGGVRYKKATTSNLEAVIDFDKWGNKTAVTVGHVLAAEIVGGNRKHKRHEVALQRAGILPSGMYAVPGAAADLDAYGNMRGGQIVQILAWFRAMGEQGYKANMGDKGRARLEKDNKSGERGFEYVVIYRHRSLPPGIYKKFKFTVPGSRKSAVSASSLKPVMIFVRSPMYRKRFDFYGMTERVAREHFGKAFSHYLEGMLKERGL